MPDITELNLPDPKKAELIRQRQLRIAEIEAMPDDDPAEADKLLGAITPAQKQRLLDLLSRIHNNLVNGKLKK